MGAARGVVGNLHARVVRSRRASVLAQHLASLMPAGTSVLDVGTGEGQVAQALSDERPDIRIEGIDVLVRPDLFLPVREFDGQHVPHDDDSFDIVQFVDVLHHTEDPRVLLAEARRVARQAIVIKDHTKEGFLAGPTLRFMDWVGNHYVGVALPYNYWTAQQWDVARRELGFEETARITKLGLRRPPFSLLFDRSLHFVARWNLSKD